LTAPLVFLEDEKVVAPYFNTFHSFLGIKTLCFMLKKKYCFAEKTDMDDFATAIERIHRNSDKIKNKK